VPLEFPRAPSPAFSLRIRALRGCLASSRRNSTLGIDHPRVYSQFRDAGPTTGIGRDRAFLTVHPFAARTKSFRGDYGSREERSESHRELWDGRLPASKGEAFNRLNMSLRALSFCRCGCFFGIFAGVAAVLSTKANVKRWYYPRKWEGTDLELRWNCKRPLGLERTTRISSVFFATQGAETPGANLSLAFQNKGT
jgi:hypothetical protein